MNSSSRNAIAAPAIGLMVFDNSTNSFWFYGNGGWQEVASDADPDPTNELELPE
jgi:hypothetical protein